MPTPRDTRLGKCAMQLLLNDDNYELEMKMQELGWRYCVGKVGSMDASKIVAAVETAAKNSGMIEEAIYREGHSLYHAILEALHGITRGQIQLGSVMRTVGLTFSIVRGDPFDSPYEGEWIAVALYGTIGAPVRGFEHEAIGLGINHM